MIRRELLVGTLCAAAIATVAGGCGSKSGTNSASRTLDAKVATAFVDAQARALCLVQSKAYSTQAALHAAYIRAEHSSKLSPSELSQAQAAVAHETALRIRISDRVSATCGRR